MFTVFKTKDAHVGIDYDSKDTAGLYISTYIGENVMTILTKKQAEEVAMALLEFARDGSGQSESIPKSGAVYGRHSNIDGYFISAHDLNKHITFAGDGRLLGVMNTQESRNRTIIEILG